MSQRFAPIAAALTGQLTFILIVSAVLALVASYLLLRLYRRAVITSMQRRRRSEFLEPKGFLPPEPEHKPNDAPLSFSFVTRDGANANKRALVLYRSAIRRRWQTALVHTLAGCVFAAAMATAFLTAGKLEFSPFRFLFLTWVNGWPIILAIDLAIGIFRRARLASAIAYFLIGGVIAAVFLAKNPGLPIAQLLYLWLGSNAPATLLLVIFLNRRIRAVGPLVLVFMVLSVTGASLIVALTGNNQKLLKAISDFSFAIGFGATGTLVALHMIGFAAFAILGWLILGSLCRLYERKQISAQSITVDAVWLLFGIVNSVGLVFEGRWWILSGLGAFALYKVIEAVLFRALAVARRAQASGRRLLLLRVFALGKRGETLYDALGKSWRAVGSMQMIAGPDLAASAIEPHEFLDFLGGKLARRFIDSGQTLDLRMNQMDLHPDKDGQFRVSEFFCHDDTWKLTLARLADESDAVLMDLRGFSPKNAGGIFEINELFNLVPLRRAVFAVDETTDQPFLRQTMQQAWSQLKDRSPNRRLPDGQVSLVELSAMSADGIHNLLYALCAAASAKPT
jgi:hypothetical protein